MRLTIEKTEQQKVEYGPYTFAFYEYKAVAQGQLAYYGQTC